MIYLQRGLRRSALWLVQESLDRQIAILRRNGFLTTVEGKLIINCNKIGNYKRGNNTLLVEDRNM